MFTRNETIFQWTLYTLAALLCFFLQSALLQRMTLFGVVPFLYPAIAAVACSYEDAFHSSIFALLLGVLCDLLLPGPIPCFYTLIFPILGICSALIAKSLLPAGLICSLGVSAAAFVVLNLFRTMLLLAGGHSVGFAGFLLTVQEILAAIPFVIPMSFLFRAVHRRVHRDD